MDVQWQHGPLVLMHHLAPSGSLLPEAPVARPDGADVRTEAGREVIRVVTCSCSQDRRTGRS